MWSVLYEGPLERCCCCFCQYTVSNIEYCKSINVCASLIVQISRVVENRKRLWPQTFSGTFQRLVPTTCRQRSVDRPVSRGSLGYWKVRSRTRQHNTEASNVHNLSKAQLENWSTCICRYRRKLVGPLIYLMAIGDVSYKSGQLQIYIRKLYFSKHSPII